MINFEWNGIERRSSSQLREAAEGAAQCVPMLETWVRPAKELLYELQVYQIELEMQNETLRQSQIELEKSRDRYVDLYDFAPIGYLTLTPDAIISKINLTGAALLGVERNKLFNRRFVKSIAAEDRDRWHRYLLDVLNESGTLSCELRLQHGDGTVFFAHLDGRHMADDSGARSVRIALTDITAQKLAEDSLRISTLKHQLLFESSRDALMTLAPPSWKFTAANEATLKLFGASGVAEFTALGPVDVSPERQTDGGASRVKMQEMIATALSAGMHSFEWQHQRLDGQPFAADVLLTRMELGEGLFLQATVRDISQRKRTETALIEHRQLLRELAAKVVTAREAECKHIAREVHDELGQILTALRMDVSLLRIQFGERDPSLLKKIQDMLVLVDKAIRGVRDVTVNLRPPALDMGLVPAIAWLCEEFPKHTTAACTLRVIEYPARLTDACIMAIFRIVQESLTNVVRHAEASRVEIIIGQCADDITVEVRDDGKGIDPDATMAKKSFGLLGMKERALALGGKVEITSAPLHGTVISVSIPIQSEGTIL